MTERTLSRLPIVDLWMKGGALGVALVMAYFLYDFVTKQYDDNKALQQTIIGIVREQNGGLVDHASALRDMTRVVEANNRLIETILYERRTTTRPTANLSYAIPQPE